MSETKTEDKVLVDKKHLLDTIKEWEEEPQKMFDWRSKALKATLLTLQAIIEEPSNPKSRSQYTAKIKAADQLRRYFVDMGAMRVDIPVVCPNCNEEHLVP